MKLYYVLFVFAIFQCDFIYAQKNLDSIIGLIKPNNLAVFGELHGLRPNWDLENGLLIKAHGYNIISLQEAPASVIFDVLLDIKNLDSVSLSRKWQKSPDLSRKYFGYMQHLKEGANLNFYPVDIEDNFKYPSYSIYRLAGQYSSECTYGLKRAAKKLFKARMKKKAERWADTVLVLSEKLFTKNILSPFDSLWLRRLCSGLEYRIYLNDFSRIEKQCLREVYMKESIKQILNSQQTEDSIFMYGFFGMAHVSKGFRRKDNPIWRSMNHLISQDSTISERLTSFLILYKLRSDNMYYLNLLSQLTSAVVSSLLLEASSNDVLFSTFPELKDYFDFYIHVEKLE